MKALPPSPDHEAPTVETGLSVAMEGINIAIGAAMADERDPHRYSEIMRLATIGKALDRQRARAAKRVSSFIPPGATDPDRPEALNDYQNLGGLGGRRRYRNGPNFVCNVNDGGDLADVEDLGNEPVDAPGDREPRDLNGPMYGGAIQGGIGYAMNPRPHIGAPFGVGGGDDPNAALMGMAAGIGGAFQGIVDTRAAEQESQRRLDRAKEIDALSRALDRTTDEAARARLQRLIDRATSQLEDDASAQPTEPPPRPDPSDEVEDAEFADGPRVRWSGDPIIAGPPLRRIVCTDPECGNAHGTHWTTADGTPRDCDICNAPMRLVVEAQPMPAAAPGQPAAEQP